jgi:hypothetical protein
MIIILLSGCTTIPDSIDDKYLVDKTSSQRDTLIKIENEIIEKNRAVKTSQDTLDSKIKIPEFTDSEIKLLDRENSILRDQVDLYVKYKDARNIELRKSRLAENEAYTKRKKALNELQKADIELAKADLEVKQADLAVSVAELEYEKSKIAAAYRDKNEIPEPEQKKGVFSKITGSDNKADDKYGYSVYGQFLDKKRTELQKAREKHAAALKKFEDARKNSETLN